MPRNVEIKARLPDASVFERLLRRAEALATETPVWLEQDDTFFHCAQGRLKLRVVEGGAAELIAYERPDLPGPKTSTYVRTAVADAQGMRSALAAACGVLGRVRKLRLLLMAGRTRIHLDAVDGLGHFLELEVVLQDGEDDRDGVGEAQALLARLGVPAAWLVRGAYLDMLPSGAGAGR